MKYRWILPAIALILCFLVSCEDSDQKGFSFVQLCDPQLGMGGYDHDKDSLRLAVSRINDIGCDFVVICGDLVHHASDSSFADFMGITEQLEMPVYLVAGNHDVGNTPNDSTLAYFRNNISSDYYKFEFRGYTFIVTNTQLWKTHIGEESVKHDQWFREVLSHTEAKNSPTVVIGHHPLFVRQVDEEEAYFNLPETKRKEILDLLAGSPAVAYLSGHKHETLINSYEGIQLVTGESTSRNFDKRPLGFRLWEADRDTLWHRFVSIH